jgi:hypothetical protein
VADQVTDTDRIEAYLLEHGSITSYEIRVKGLSGNPSQRVTELQDRGHHITAERFQRDGRPCVTYTLVPASSPPCAGVKPMGESSERLAVNGRPQQITSTPGGTSSSPGDSLPRSGPSLSSDRDSARAISEQRGGAGISEKKVCGRTAGTPRSSYYAVEEAW